jgi:hypothetical protein
MKWETEISIIQIPVRNLGNGIAAVTGVPEL